MKQIGQVLPFVPCISEKSHVIQQNFLMEHKAMSISDILTELINIAKGTTDPRVEFILQVHSSQISNIYNFRISIKLLLQNLNLT